MKEASSSQNSEDTVKRIYELFDQIEFDECYDCDNKCCSLPWFLREEQRACSRYLRKNGDMNGPISWLSSSNGCRFAVNNRCQIYKERALDCRMFPLDILEEDGKYWWIIFKNCSKYKEIGKKLIPLIPKLELLFDKNIVKQYKRQISITKELYPPYKLGLYEKVKEFEEKYNK